LGSIISERGTKAVEKRGLDTILHFLKLPLVLTFYGSNELVFCGFIAFDMSLID